MRYTYSALQTIWVVWTQLRWQTCNFAKWTIWRLWIVCQMADFQIWQCCSRRFSAAAISKSRLVGCQVLWGQCLFLRIGYDLGHCVGTHRCQRMVQSTNSFRQLAIQTTSAGYIVLPRMARCRTVLSYWFFVFLCLAHLHKFSFRSIRVSERFYTDAFAVDGIRNVPSVKILSHIIRIRVS